MRELIYILNFPDDFFEMKGYELPLIDINEYLRTILKDNNDYDYISCGDTIILKHLDKIIIAKKYWIADIQEK
jgi:hypothetical protein